MTPLAGRYRSSEAEPGGICTESSPCERADPFLQSSILATDAPSTPWTHDGWMTPAA
jgi:hypothetical protein